MRLGQLSRKVSVRPAEIITFLKKNGISVEESANARIADEHVTLVRNHFAPDWQLEPEEGLAMEEPLHGDNGQQTITDVGQAPEPEAVFPAESEITKAAPEVNDGQNLNIAGENPEHMEKRGEDHGDGMVEVIRAPKLELQGLKVLGKIELPEPKKKEVEKSGDETVSELPESPVRHRKRQDAPNKDRRPRHERPRKNPVALERERREREEAERKKIALAKAKEKKKQHYQKRVKVKGPTKAARIYDEPVTSSESFEDQPKSWWGRFVKWLTSY